MGELSVKSISLLKMTEWKDFSSGGGAGGRMKDSCGSLAAEMRLGRSCANSGIVQPLPATSGKD